MVMNNQVSLVERGGLRLSFFLLGSEAQKWSSQVLKTKDSQARFCFVKFFRVAKMSQACCIYVTVKQ
jgi:hypothetical protein